MNNLASFLLNLLSSAYNLFDKVLEPNPKSFQNKLQQEVQHQRNKAIALFHLFAMGLVFTQTIAKRFPLSQAFTTFVIGTSTLTLLLLSCKFHTKFFNITYSGVLAFAGPMLSAMSTQGCVRAWISAHLYPTIIFLCTEDIYYLIFQTCIQLGYVNTIYQSKMMKFLDVASSAEFLESLTISSNTMCLWNMVIIIFINSSLKNAYNKVQAAEEKKDEFEKQKIFLLSFSHELRNILNSLMGNMKLASLESLSTKARNFIENADLCAESLLHLINNILDSGKVEIGDLEINPAPTNIYDTMERIWRICSEQIKAKHLYGSLKIQKNIPETLEIDHHRLMQIFFNLIGNAVKFTEKGSITITVEWIRDTNSVTDKTFEPYPFDEGNEMNEGIFEKNQRMACFDRSYLSLNSSKNKIDTNEIGSFSNREITKGLLKVVVTDTGSGITSEDAAKLFQKFCQVSSDPAQRKLGTGLGLFITKQLCERMDGEIRMFSKQGKGSSFIFCIPVRPLPSRQSSVIPYQNVSQIKIMKAMVVDDEALSRSILENYLTKINVEVIRKAQNGLEAYNNYKDCYYKGNYIDIVTMDLTMPVMGGKRSAEKIREFEMENGIVPCLMIVISANCSESEIAECTNRNGKIRADFFLKKPARIDEIARAITRHQNYS